jgi:hypothetical protein
MTYEWLLMRKENQKFAWKKLGEDREDTAIEE